MLKCFISAKYYYFLRSLAEECDDGDLIEGDGCSRTCKKEKGFHCVGEFRKASLFFVVVFFKKMTVHFVQFLCGVVGGR